MIPRKITVGRTIPLGDYASERIDIELELAEGETKEQALEYGRQFISRNMMTRQQLESLAPTDDIPFSGGVPVQSVQAASAGPLTTTTITEKQLKASYAIARALQHLSEEQVDTRCLEMFDCKPDKLSKAQASQFIDSLKNEVPA